MIRLYTSECILSVSNITCNTNIFELKAYKDLHKYTLSLETQY